MRDRSSIAGTGLCQSVQPGYAACPHRPFCDPRRLMTAPRLSILVTRALPQDIESRMRDLFDVRLNADDVPMTAGEIAAGAVGVDAVVPTVTDRFDAGLIANLPETVRLLANFGVGVNHIDLDAAAARGIVVTNTPDVLTDDTADIALGLMLAVPRRLVEGDRLVRSGSWQGWSPTFMVGRRLTGRRLGIVGMGRIGQAVARRALGFGMRVQYHNRRRLPVEVEHAVQATWQEDLDRMLAETDVLSINCPYTPETRHLLDERRLNLLPRNAIVVNTARGEIIDEAALARCLADGRLAGAGLDVYEREPAVEPALLALDTVVLAPHLGSATRESRTAMGEKVISNITAFFAQNDPPDRVGPR